MQQCSWASRSLRCSWMLSDYALWVRYVKMGQRKGVQRQSTKRQEIGKEPQSLYDVEGGKSTIWVILSDILQCSGSRDRKAVGWERMKMLEKAAEILVDTRTSKKASTVGMHVFSGHLLHHVEIVPSSTYAILHINPARPSQFQLQQSLVTNSPCTD